MCFLKTEMHTHICCRPIKKGVLERGRSILKHDLFLPPCTAPSLQDAKQWPEQSLKEILKTSNFYTDID